MREVFNGRPETQKIQGTIIDFEAARLKRTAGEKTQTPRSGMAPPTRETRQERSSADRLQAIREELGRTHSQSRDVNEREQAAGTPEERRLFDEIFGGQTEEQITAHNERFQARREKERSEKEKIHEEALKQYTRHQERLAAMSSSEREAYDKNLEKIKTGMTPLPPEEWKQLIRTMSANMKRQERAKAAWVHERDPRYDPMTGDLLEPDEFPLDAKAEYYFDGKERPRRFIPPDSPHLNDYKPLETENEQEVSEGEYRDRLVNRLRKAGFVEVEPTLMDKVLYEKTRWFENLPPEAKIDFLQEALREVTQERLQNEDTAGEKFAQMIELVIEFVIALFKSTAEAEETPAKKAA